MRELYGDRVLRDSQNVDLDEAMNYLTNLQQQIRRNSATAAASTVNVQTDDFASILETYKFRQLSADQIQKQRKNIYEQNSQ